MLLKEQIRLLREWVAKSKKKRKKESLLGRGPYGLPDRLVQMDDEKK